MFLSTPLFQVDITNNNNPTITATVTGSATAENTNNDNDVNTSSSDNTNTNTNNGRNFKNGMEFGESLSEMFRKKKLLKSRAKKEEVGQKKKQVKGSILIQSLVSSLKLLSSTVPNKS